MTLDSKKEKLKSLQQLYVITKMKQSELEELKELTQTIKSPTYGNIKAVGVNSDAICNSIINVDVLETEYKEVLNQYVSLKKSILGAIKDIKNTKQMLLLQYRYVEYRSWADISFKLNLEYNYTFKLHKEALRNINLI